MSIPAGWQTGIAEVFQNHNFENKKNLPNKRSHIMCDILNIIRGEEISESMPGDVRQSSN
jgi:hypothetical protein